MVLGKRPPHGHATFVCSTKVWNDTAHRYLHAKALLLDFGDRLALMSGSANPSRPAWISGERTNFEAMLLRTSLGEADQGIVDELLSAFAAPTMTAEDLNAVAARLPDSSSNTSAQCLPVCIAPVDQMGRVIIPTRTPTGLISAQAFSSHPQGDRTVPVTKDASGDYVVALGEHHTSVRWLVLSTDGDPDLRVIVQHPQEVRRADADSKRLDLMNALGALSDSVDIDWERLVSLAAPVIFSNELDEVDNSPDNSFREGSHRSDAGTIEANGARLAGAKSGSYWMHSSAASVPARSRRAVLPPAPVRAAGSWGKRAPPQSGGRRRQHWQRGRGICTPG